MKTEVPFAPSGRRFQRGAHPRAGEQSCLDLLDACACVELVEPAQASRDVADAARDVGAATVNWTTVDCEDHDDHDR